MTAVRHLKNIIDFDIYRVRLVSSCRRDFYVKFCYVFLHQVDLVLTVLATSAGFSELNPVMLGMLSSPFQMVLIKLIIPLLIALLVPGKLLAPAIALLFLVVCWNLKELFLLVL